MATDEEAIWYAISQANDAWVRGEVNQLAKLFGRNAVLVAPRLEGRMQGREAIAASYEEYNRKANTHSFVIDKHEIDVFGDMAVATYVFTVRYEIDGAVNDEAGQEILVLTRAEGSWCVAWRTQVPLGSAQT